VSSFIIGLDLGQAQDYTALCVAEMFGGDKSDRYYHIRHLQRFKLGTSYPEIVEIVSDLVSQKPLKEKSKLVVDSTGVGAPVVDMLKQAQLHPIAVTITGGNEVNRNGSAYKVPKRDMVSNLQVLFQGGRLKIAEELSEARTLVNELLNFKVKISAKAHDTYEAWREGIHDDLVLAVALACWYGQNSFSEVRFRWLL